MLLVCIHRHYILFELQQVKLPLKEMVWTCSWLNQINCGTVSLAQKDKKHMHAKGWML